jgi:TIR domain/PTS HPr component phosphorylation site
MIRTGTAIAMVGLKYFSEWEVILVDLRSGKETNAASIMGMMMLAVTPGTEVEFFSLMPNDVWNKYVEILSALFYTLDEENIKNNWVAYEALKGIFYSIPEMPENRDLLLQRLRETARSYNIEHFFSGFSTPDRFTEDERLRLESNLRAKAAYDVFISKVTEDLDYAKELYFFLERSGQRTFLSEFSIRKESDSDFQEVIEQALNSAKHLIVLGSRPAAFKSDWVKAEWRTFLAEKRAGRKHGNLITIRTGHFGIEKLPIALRTFQSIEWGEDCFLAVRDFLI